MSSHKHARLTGSCDAPIEGVERRLGQRNAGPVVVRNHNEKARVFTPGRCDRSDGKVGSGGVRYTLWVLPA